MLTIKKNIKFENEEDKVWVLHMQRLHSIAFRKMYSFLKKEWEFDLSGQDEKQRKLQLRDEITEKYIFSSKAYEYLLIEVQTFIKIEETNKNKLIEKVADLKEKLKVQKHKSKGWKKLEANINRLTKSIKSPATFGSKKMLQDITSQSQKLAVETDEKKKEELQSLCKKNVESFRKARVLPMSFQGETSRNGNRFFDLSDLQNGNVVFNYNCEKEKKIIKKKIELSFFAGSENSKIKKQLAKLSDIAMKGEISISVKITNEYICLSYDEAKLNGYYYDYRAVNKELKSKNITDEEEKKTYRITKIREHEAKCLESKIENRFTSMDTNPSGLGYVIMDRQSFNTYGDFKIVSKKFVSFSGLNDPSVSAEKREYEICVAMNNMFADMIHHKAGNFIYEDMEGISDNKNVGGTEVNRLINNVWCRTLIEKQYKKHCAINGIKMIPIEPKYSSFVGNILFNEYDPVAAAIEIGRRGIIKYIKKGQFYLTLSKELVTGVSKDTKMDYQVLEPALKSLGSWQVLSKIVKTARKSVRRTDLATFQFQSRKQNGVEKSRVQTLVFP